MRPFLLLLGAVLAAACDDPAPLKNPFEPPPKVTKDPPPVTEPVQPTGPPQIKIGEEGPKIGWNEILIEKSDGRERLKTEVAANKQHWDGKKVALFIDRKAKLRWVVAMLEELAAAGATGFTINTGTRKEYSGALDFVPESKVDKPASCALVGMVLEDRATAIWSLEGGGASKRPKGMAGPDLTTTQETIERRGKACKGSTSFFVSAAESVEWGLAYDLAAAAAQVPEPKLDTFVLLTKTPVAGRRVTLGSSG